MRCPTRRTRSSGASASRRSARSGGSKTPAAEEPRAKTRCISAGGGPTTMTEAELIARAKRGDAAAYEELVRIHQGIAFRTAWLVAGNAADAEEAAQDGFVKAYRALWRVPPGGPFKPDRERTRP